MNKRISLGAALAVMLIVAAATFSMTMIYARTNFNQRVYALKERENEYEKFAEIDRLVRLNYYGSITENKLMDSVAKGYVEGTGDTYARYLSAEEYKKYTETDEGESVGIGAVISQSPDDFYLVVDQVYPDSPAQVAGMVAGDLIVKIDETDLTRENSRQMLESIQGAQGTTITVVYRRGAVDSTAPMTRRVVAIPTVESRMLEQAQPEEPLVGYIRIIEFGERTYDQFNREMQKLIDAGATSLVLDVRDNKGTTLKSATRILDRLLPAGVLVTATYKDGSTAVIATSDANLITLPLVVLTNAGTASSAELFAQSIKDFEKGRIVGATTAGKGVVQDIVKLSDGSAIELTVGHYQPKSGLNFNGVGIKPDFEVKLDAPDWTKLDDTTDTQHIKAKEVAIAQVNAAAGEAGSSESSTVSSEASDGSSSQPASSSQDESSDGDSSESSGEDSSTDSGEDASGESSEDSSSSESE